MAEGQRKTVVAPTRGLVACPVRVIIVWGTAALVLCLVVVADSFLPGGPHLPAVVWTVCFVGMFPAFVAMIIKVNRRVRKYGAQAGLPALTRSVPIWIRSGLSVLFVAAVLNFWLLFALGPQGQPQATATGYQLDNHGSITPISEREYRRDLAAGDRTFAGVAAVFNAVSATLALGLRRLQQRDLDATFTGLDD